MSEGFPRRPFPFRLLWHWFKTYAVLWVLLGFVIFIVQTVLAAMLHERDDLRAFLQILDRAPKIFKAFIGGDELMMGNVLGVVAIGYQHPLVLVSLMIGAVSVPTGILTGQAEQGTIEILLARPLTRARIYWMAAGLTLVGGCALVSVIFGATALWTNTFDYGQPIPLTPFFHVALNLMALAAAVGGLSTLVAVVVNERNRAVGIVIGYLVVSYLVDFAAVWWPRLKMLHPYSLFQYCVANRVIRGGTVPTYQISVLMTICVVSLIAGYLIWRRKDLAAA